MKYQILGPAKYGGRCVTCRQTVRDFEAVLLGHGRGKDRQFAVACERCAGGRFRSKINRGRVWSGPDTMEVSES